MVPKKLFQFSTLFINNNLDKVKNYQYNKYNTGYIELYWDSSYGLCVRVNGGAIAAFNPDRWV